jgi:hypothetical protein
MTHFVPQVGDGRAEAIEPGLFEAVEPGAIQCHLIAAQASLEPRGVALRLGQGKLALALVVTLEDGQEVSRLHVLPLGDAYLFHAHARPGPDHDRPRFRLQMRQGPDVRASDGARSPARRLGLGGGARHRDRQGHRSPSAGHQDHGRRLRLQYLSLRGCAPPSKNTLYSTMIVISRFGKTRDE